jgi:hypothetical protein
MVQVVQANFQCRPNNEALIAGQKQLYCWIIFWERHWLTMSVKHQALRAANFVAPIVFRQKLPTDFYGKLIWLSRPCWSSLYSGYEPYFRRHQSALAAWRDLLGCRG